MKIAAQRARHLLPAARRAGLSENISVVSIVDRFLEHSRILYYFHHGGEDRVFISSADWMPRNLDRRVELMIPIEDPASRNRLVSDPRDLLSRTTSRRTELLPDGRYQRLMRRPGERRSAARRPCTRTPLRW